MTEKFNPYKALVARKTLLDELMRHEPKKSFEPELTIHSNGFQKVVPYQQIDSDEEVECFVATR